MGGSGKFYCDTTLSTSFLHPPPPTSQVRNDDRSLTKHIHCSFYWVARAHEDLDATRDISSHCICTRHIHSLWTRSNLEAVLLVAMVATVDSHSHWLSHFDHLLQIGLWRSYWITTHLIIQFEFEACNQLTDSLLAQLYYKTTPCQKNGVIDIMKIKISMEALDLLTNEFHACTFPQLQLQHVKNINIHEFVFSRKKS